MATAKEILNQLGGNMFIAMTGATCYADGANTLVVRFKGSRLANTVYITLNSLDLYDVIFRKITTTKHGIVKEYNGIYNDQLRKIFEDTTGLLTSL